MYLEKICVKALGARCDNARFLLFLTILSSANMMIYVVSIDLTRLYKHTVQISKIYKFLYLEKFKSVNLSEICDLRSRAQIWALG